MLVTVWCNNRLLIYRDFTLGYAHMPIGDLKKSFMTKAA